MRSTLVLLGSIALVAIAGARESERKTRSTVPGPYPSIIKMAPVGEAAQASPGIIQSELGGREMQFLQLANQAGTEQAALIELARKQSGSEEIKAVAEAFATTQSTESKEVARIAAAKHFALSATSAKAISDELGSLSGAKFEKAWIERLMAVNEAGVTAYELGAKSLDADIRTFSEAMLPVAQARLQMANRLGGRSMNPKTAPAPASAAPPQDRASTPQSIPSPIAPSKPSSPP